MESPKRLPTDKNKLLDKSLELIEQCRVSAGSRAALCRQLNQIIESGRADGTRSLINLCYAHIDRLASHIFSPTDLRFTIDFENEYDGETLKRGQRAARIINRGWERRNTDMQFGAGVFESLKYGSSIMKQWVETSGEDRLPLYRSGLVMPWQFGVFREDKTDLDAQPALCETFVLTMPEVWKRVWMMPDAESLYQRVKKNAQRGQSSDSYNSFSHEVLSTSQLNVSGVGLSRPIPGGIVQLGNDTNYTSMGPEIAAELVRMHELWVQDGDDYTTIQIIEPDILIAPRFSNSNLLISGTTPSGLHPYTMICANYQHGYIWGRSELADLIEPQGWLARSADDARRLLGLQVDKFLGIFSDGITDEKYAEMRNAGFMNLGSGDKVTDLTPAFPPELIPMMEFIIKMFDMIGGFDNVLSGRGEPGVRSGLQNNALMRTASPRLRDRALLVERQCADAADLTLSLAEAKDARNYWTDPMRIEETKFLLCDLPGDRRVTVDGHTSSPIFADDHGQQVAFGIKSGFIDGHSAIEMLNYPNKDLLQRRLQDKEQQQQKIMADLAQKDPEAYAKLLTHQRSHH